MSIGFIYWLLMLLWAVFGLQWSWPAAGSFRPLGGNLLLFLLLFLIGWRLFGFPIQG